MLCISQSIRDSIQSLSERQREPGTAIIYDLEIPMLGIGAGSHTDGQGLVITNAVGLSQNLPPFASRFGDVRGEMERAVAAYRDAVRDGTFPGPAHSHVQDDLTI